MRHLKTTVLILINALLLGCSATGTLNKDIAGAGAGRSGVETGKYRDGAGAAGYGSTGSEGGYNADAANAQTNGFTAGNTATGPNIVYFQYDSSEVLPEFLPVINNHASYLSGKPNKTVVLQGHADERGSPEYNIALGEQRAKAVAQLLKLQGVSDKQIQTVSFGEEKPQNLGHDETAWQQNRRVELIYPDR